MKTMLVGISYNTDGTRYISELHYTSFTDGIELNDAASSMKRRNDEVYTIDLNPSEYSFVEYIVLHGCRM